MLFAERIASLEHFPIDLRQTFIVQKPTYQNEPIEVGDDVYERLETQYKGFKDHQLISCFDLESDMLHWECHPNGDETIVLISGKVTCILATEPESRCLLQEPGSCCVVPRGVWHRFEVHQPGRLLFITPGEGTHHRES